MKRSFLALLHAVLASLICVGAATAAPVPTVVTPNATEFAPILNGDSVIYVSTDSASDGIAEKLRIWRSSPGTLPVELASFPLGNYDHHLSIGASDQAFVAARGEIWDCGGGEGEPYDPCMEESSFLYALGANPVKTISGCLSDEAGSSWGEFGALFEQSVIAAQGTAIAIPVDKREVCGENSVVRVLDLANPAASVTIPGSAEFLSGVAMAGKYVAVLTRRLVDGPALVVKVFDRETKTVVSKRSFFTANYNFQLGANESFDIQDDGTVALNAELFRNRGKSSKRRPLCAKKQAIVITKLGGKPQCASISPATDEVKLADSKWVAYELRRGELARLVAIDLASGAKQILRTTTDAEDEPFDFDGRRITWAETACVQNSIQVAEIGPELSPAQPRCPITIPDRTITLKKHSKFSLQITCPQGCNGYWEIAGPKAIDSESKIHRGEVQFSSGDFMRLEASPSPQSNDMQFYRHVRNYLRKHPLKRIALNWISYQASIDGRHHEKTFWFNVKYR